MNAYLILLFDKMVPKVMDVIKDRILSDMSQPSMTGIHSLAFGTDDTGFGSLSSEKTLSETIHDGISNDLDLLEKTLSNIVDSKEISILCAQIVASLPFSNGNFDSEFFHKISDMYDRGMCDDDSKYYMALIYSCGIGVAKDLDKAHDILSKTERGQNLARAYRIFGYCGAHNDSDDYKSYIEAGLRMFEAYDSFAKDNRDKDLLFGLIDDYVGNYDRDLRDSVLQVSHDISMKYNVRGIDDYIQRHCKDPFSVSLIIGNDLSHDYLISDSKNAENDIIGVSERILANLDRNGDCLIYLGKRAISIDSDLDVSLPRVADYAMCSSNLLTKRSFIYS